MEKGGFQTDSRSGSQQGCWQVGSGVREGEVADDSRSYGLKETSALN